MSLIDGRGDKRKSETYTSDWITAQSKDLRVRTHLETLLRFQNLFHILNRFQIQASLSQAGAPHNQRLGHITSSSFDDLFEEERRKAN